MELKTKKNNSQSGVSLLELLIVLVVSAVLVTLAVAKIGSSKSNLQRQNIARQLKVYLERARFDSVKRRATKADDMARVTIDSATSFSLTTDLNQNGKTTDSTDVQRVDFSGGDIKFVGIASYPVIVGFDRRGQISVNNGSTSFTICNSCTSATATSANANILWVSLTGTISMTAGGESQPVFQNPVLQAVNSNSDIREFVLVTTGGGTTTNPTPTPTPISTPTPTPTPTATPTPTPSSSPTATPTPVPTPTPRPTQAACQRNQRPTQDNCRCVAPMSVRSNGKCQ